MPTPSSSSSVPSTSEKDNIIDLCTSAGEVFSKFGVLLRDLDISGRRASSENDNHDQHLIGWDAQSVTMLREAVQTFAVSMRDISTITAEKRTRER